MENFANVAGTFLVKKNPMKVFMCALEKQLAAIAEILVFTYKMHL